MFIDATKTHECTVDIRKLLNYIFYIYISRNKLNIPVKLFEFMSTNVNIFLPYESVCNRLEINQLKCEIISFIEGAFYIII